MARLSNCNAQLAFAFAQADVCDVWRVGGTNWTHDVECTSWQGIVWRRLESAIAQRGGHVGNVPVARGDPVSQPGETGLGDQKCPKMTSLQQKISH